MNRPSPHRSNQPPVPLVTSETSRALLSAAAAFGTLAPWTWMHDTELLGLRDPTTNDRLLCSILGRLQSMFALLVFRRDTGRRWVLNTILNDGDSVEEEDQDSGLEQDCVKVEFTLKTALTKEDRSVIATAGFVPRVKRGCVWPTFRSLVPGGYPWYLTQAEAELLVYALPRVGAFAALCRDTPELGVNLVTGEVPFLPTDFDPSHRALRTEDLDWQPMVTPPKPLPPAVSLDETVVERILKLPQANGFHLELDVFYAPMAVSGPERPYFPKTIMAVDRASGFVAGVRFAEATDSDAVATLATVLEGALQQLKHRPETIRVQRPRVAQMVTAMASRLGIAICQDAELPALEAARHELMQRFTR